MADKIMWTCREYVGIAMADVAPVVKMPITEDVWKTICEKAEAEGMDPNDWLDMKIEELNKELE